MENIEIISTGKYLPNVEVLNKELAQKYGVTEEYIEKRTGIKKRYFVKEENLIQIAIKAAKSALRNNIKSKEIELIIVATTTTGNLMPGISNLIQKELKIEKCICLDILAGCSGYINAFDIARNYISIGKIKTAMVIGVDILSKYVNNEDIGTAIILSDGAGATILQKSSKEKKYESNIKSDGENSQILTCRSDEKIYMDGKAIYKYAVTETVKNVTELLQNSKETLENIKYIVPHQSNIKIINSIATRLGIENEKMYTNLQNVGNTFCASIPIVLFQMFEEKKLKVGDKIILLGYGGGLNTGSILIEI